MSETSQPDVSLDIPPSGETDRVMTVDEFKSLFVKGDQYTEREVGVQLALASDGSREMGRVIGETTTLSSIGYLREGGNSIDSIVAFHSHPSVDTAFAERAAGPGMHRNGNEQKSVAPALEILPSTGYREFAQPAGYSMGGDLSQTYSTILRGVDSKIGAEVVALPGLMFEDGGTVNIVSKHGLTLCVSVEGISESDETYKVWQDFLARRTDARGKEQRFEEELDLFLETRAAPKWHVLNTEYKREFKYPGPHGIWENQPQIVDENGVGVYQLAYYARGLNLNFIHVPWEVMESLGPDFDMYDLCFGNGLDKLVSKVQDISEGSAEVLANIPTTPNLHDALHHPADNVPLSEADTSMWLKK